MHGRGGTGGGIQAGQSGVDRPWSAENGRLFLYVLSFGLDLLAVFLGFEIASGTGPQGWVSYVDAPILLIALSLFVMFSVGLEVQAVETLQDWRVGLRRAMLALVAAFIAQLMMFFVTKIGEDVSRLGFATFFAAAGLALLVSHLLQRALTRLFLGHQATSTVLLLDGIHVEPDPGMVRVDLSERALTPDLRKPEMITAISEVLQGFDRVVVACPERRYVAWLTYLQGADIAAEIIVGEGRLRGVIGIGRCASQDTFIVSRGPLSMGNRIKKRSFDLIVGCAMLAMLAPLMIVVAILIKLDSPGPVFFRQLRIGKGNRYFQIFKFRSMQWGQTDRDGNVSAARGDPRVTRVGKFIRRVSIDELPQLLNVLRGHMSLVGPRPHALGSLAGSQLFWDVNERYWQRHSLRPGITGLAQIRGFRGATDDAADLENRLRCDLEYLANWSLTLDLQILAATLRVIIHDKAY